MSWGDAATGVVGTAAWATFIFSMRAVFFAAGVALEAEALALWAAGFLAETAALLRGTAAFALGAGRFADFVALGLET
jgi:hypothetical protein